MMHRPQDRQAPFASTYPSKAARRVIAPYVKLIRKKYREPVVPESKLFRRQLEKKPSVLLRDLTTFLSDDVELPALLHESVDVIRTSTKSCSAYLFLIDQASGFIHQSQRYIHMPVPRVQWKPEIGSIVVSHVAYTKEVVMVDDIIRDDRFPEGIGLVEPMAKSVLCVPIITSDGECYAIIQLIRNTLKPPFSERELKLTTLVANWMGAAIYQNIERVETHKKMELNDYLLELTKVYVEDYVPTERMLTEMVHFLGATMSAEKSSLYLLDLESDFVADVYTKTIKSETVEKLTNVRLGEKDKDIVATVARFGKTINIKDARNDPKYKKPEGKLKDPPRSILCMAIKDTTDIIGVLEVINKSTVCFLKSDEILLDVFATYFSLVLQFHNLHEDVKKQEVMNNLEQNLLSRQIEPCIHDYTHFMSNLNVNLPASFSDFKWYIPEELSNEIPIFTYAMLRHFTAPNEMNVENLARFILALRKFDDVGLPFHNNEHAFTFCHTMFNILKRNDKLFTSMECVALLIAGLGHVVGRRACTNEYLALSKDELWEIFPHLTWQNYHALITRNILTEFPIFNNVSKEAYNSFLDEVKLLMINTDMRYQFYGTDAKEIAEIVESGEFDNKDPKQHFLLKSLCLTCCDMSWFGKAFTVVQKVGEAFYYEMWKEAELIKNIKPDQIVTEFFDVEKHEKIAEQQIHLIDMFILKIAGMLKQILPNTSEIYDGILSTRQTWIEIIELRGRKTWKQEESYIKKKVETSYY